MKHLDGIPTWFELNRYEALKDLSEYELATQLYIRIVLFETSIEDSYFVSTPEDCRKNIIVTEALDDTENTIHKTKSCLSKIPILPRGTSIASVDIFDVHLLFRTAQENYDYPPNSEGIYLTNDAQTSIDLLHQTVSATVKIDLTNNDAVILDELKALLPLYREQLNIQKPKSPGNTARKRTLDYQLIPYLDLMIYCKQYNMKLRNQTIAETLYPLGHRDDKFISGTLASFLKTVSSYNFMDEWLASSK
ncbi:DUF6387 family protein [Neptuniibacter sp. QD48_55]|uniref:DUF6387 family protein n=1 Tax=Neptuniibacter sp. QD48_55 TaxID=3398212 RepID=UPI0039F47033